MGCVREEEDPLFTSDVVHDDIKLKEWKTRTGEAA